MKRFAATVVALALLSLVCAHANQASGTASSDAPAATSSTQSQTITITRSGSQPSSTGAAAYFTGSGRIEPLFQAKDSARAVGARVTFVPGARIAWHPPTRLDTHRHGGHRLDSAMGRLDRGDPRR